MSQVSFPILSDEEFLEMATKKGWLEELNVALLQARREGKVQLFDDDSGDPLVVKVEQTN